MLRRRLLITAMWLLSAVLPPSVFAQQTYRLICRGGPGMRVRISPGDVRNSYQKLGLFFNKSGRAAGQTGKPLQPGTCAWVDRPLNAQEPDIVAQHIRQGFQYHVDVDRGGHVTRFTPETSIYAWVNDVRDPDKFWTFYAYNTNQGELRATRSYRGTGVPI